MSENNLFIENVIKDHNHDTTNLIMILQDIQSKIGYLTPEAIAIVSEKLAVPQSQIYSVATFYKSFYLKPRGKHKIDICEGTACHIRGASLLTSQAAQDLGIEPGATTADGEFTLNAVHCVGACAMAPVIVIDGTNYGGMTPANLSKEIKKCCSADSNPVVHHEKETVAAITERIDSPAAFSKLRSAILIDKPIAEPKIMVCAGTGCLTKGSLKVAAALNRELSAAGVDLPVKIGIKTVGCQGFCEKGPLVIIHPDNIFYSKVSEKDAHAIVHDTVINKKVVDKLLYHEPGNKAGIEKYHEIPFFSGQKRTALRHVGLINPLDLGDYIAHGGYSSLFKALYEMEPGQIINEIEASGLRGRGGGGFPTGKKWRTAAAVEADIRYVICNGAFMDCSIMEGDPHSVIEGMLICAYAVGASRGYIYVREEYPRALQHLQAAIEQATAAGLLGKNIGGTSFNFAISINRGKGAFVCGESTALMQSIAGKVSEPRAKYIRSAERGLFDKPTVLNNVETFVNIPVIIEKGARWFAATGTKGSSGTKVFSVVGKVKNTGLVEVPMGTTLRTVIYDLCGGILNNGKFKAVQTGGPSGGCLPESKLDLPMDFDTLTREGSMMGSGGMIVMDEDTCMVDVARYFTDFLTQESCGKCSACRLGLSKLHEILEAVCQGKGQAEDIDKIEKLLFTLEKGSLCGLGTTAPNPVRSTLTHFKDEYLAHIQEKRCPAGFCRALISYDINESCTGCRLCARACPQHAITGEKKERHLIDQELCNRCGICKATCKFSAIDMKK